MLPYGGRCFPPIFHRLTQAARHMIAKRGYTAIIVYLDDVLVIGAMLEECQQVFDCLLELLQESGFDISWHKVVPPTQCLIFLCVLIIIVSQCLSLPHEKLMALQVFVHDFLHRHRASKRQLQVLAGKMN